jgi:hypothetical protein
VQIVSHDGDCHFEHDKEGAMKIVRMKIALGIEGQMRPQILTLNNQVIADCTLM